jgi:hypothetical protein
MVVRTVTVMTTHCDRCDTEIDRYQADVAAAAYEYRIGTDAGYGELAPADLCPSCSAALAAFMRGETVDALDPF